MIFCCYTKQIVVQQGVNWLITQNLIYIDRDEWKSFGWFILMDYERRFFFRRGALLKSKSLITFQFESLSLPIWSLFKNMNFLFFSWLDPNFGKGQSFWARKKERKNYIFSCFFSLSSFNFSHARIRWWGAHTCRIWEHTIWWLWWWKKVNEIFFSWKLGWIFFRGMHRLGNKQVWSQFLAKKDKNKKENQIKNVKIVRSNCIARGCPCQRL